MKCAGQGGAVRAGRHLQGSVAREVEDEGVVGLEPAGGVVERGPEVGAGGLPGQGMDPEGAQHRVPQHGEDVLGVLGGELEVAQGGVVVAVHAHHQGHAPGGEGGREACGRGHVRLDAPGSRHCESQQEGEDGVLPPDVRRVEGLPILPLDAEHEGLVEDAGNGQADLRLRTIKRTSGERHDLAALLLAGVLPHGMGPAGGGSEHGGLRLDATDTPVRHPALQRLQASARRHGPDWGCRCCPPEPRPGPLLRRAGPGSVGPSPPDALKSKKYKKAE